MSDALDAIAVSGLLLARLRAIGIDPDRVLARALVPASRFEPGGKLATREFFATWHAIDEEPDSSGPPPSSRSPVEAARIFRAFGGRAPDENEIHIVMSRFVEAVF